MNSKSLSFDPATPGDMSLFAALVAALQYESVKFFTERDGSNLVIRFV